MESPETTFSPLLLPGQQVVFCPVGQRAQVVALIGGLVGQGATQLGLGRHRDVAMDGGIPACSDVRVDRRPSEKAMFGRRCSISGRRGIGHSELIISRYGLRGVRVGEASNRGPSRELSPSDILCRLETVLTRLDSSGEEPCGRNVARSVSVMDHTIPPPDVHARRPSRRVVLAPQSRLLQDLSSNRFESQCRIKRVRRVMWFQTFPASPNALYEAGVLARAPHCWMSWRTISPELTTTKFWAERQRARC